MTRDEAAQIAVKLRKSLNEACWLAWRNGLAEPRGEVAEHVYGYRHGWYLVGGYSFNGDSLDVAEHGCVLPTYEGD